MSPTYFPATYWGGPIHSVRALNNALALLPGVHLTVLTTDAAGRSVRERVTRIQDHDYPGQRVIMVPRVAGDSVSLALLRRLPELVRAADLVHVTATYSFPTLPTLTLCRVLHKPVVWSPRGAILDAHVWADAPKRRLKRMWNRTCDHLLDGAPALVHVTSLDEQAATDVALPHVQSTVIPNGVEVPPPVPRTWLPEGRLRLMYMGRISPKKGIERLLKALALLDDRRISLRVYGTGDTGYVDEVKTLATSLGLLGTSVHFLGHVDGEAKAAAFRDADVCVVPSYTENFCMVVAESLAHGVPVIASTGTPWRDVERHACGLWIDAEPVPLASAIRRVYQIDLATMGRDGRRWMADEFSWDSAARRMLGAYQQLRGGTRGQ